MVANTTASPPAPRLLPLASLACTVMVEVAWPSAVMEAGLAEMVVVAAAVAPGLSATWALSVMAAPSSVPVMVAVPAKIPAVKVAV